MIDKITCPVDILELRRKERERRRLKVLERVKSILEDFLQSEQEIEKLYIVGSLVREGAFGEYSDIDIALSVRSREKFWEVCDKIEELLGEKVHIIAWDSLTDEEKRFLEDYGLRLK